MKTIFVVYTDTNFPVEFFINNRTKRYVFRTKADVHVGDRLDSPSYSTPMLVTDVLNEDWRYFNAVTGSLDNEPLGTNMYPIKVLEVLEKKENTVYAIKQ